MNNFDTPEKILSIDAAIETILDENVVDWRDRRLYSWGYTKGCEPLDVMHVYGKAASFNNVSNRKVSGNISSKFITVKNGSNPKFIMELSSILYSGTLPYNIVISDMVPDAKLFDGYELHSDIGRWYNGLK